MDAMEVNNAKYHQFNEENMECSRSFNLDGFLIRLREIENESLQQLQKEASNMFQESLGGQGEYF